MITELLDITKFRYCNKPLEENITNVLNTFRKINQPRSKKKKKIAKNIERDTRVECLAKIPAFVSFNDDKKLLEDAMLFALQHKQLTENEIKTTKHFRKSFLRDKKRILEKR